MRTAISALVARFAVALALVASVVVVALSPPTASAGPVATTGIAYAYDGGVAHATTHLNTRTGAFGGYDSLVVPLRPHTAVVSLSRAAKGADDIAEVGTDLAVRPKLKPSWHYLHERKMERGLRTADVLDAYKNPLAIGKTRYDEFGRPSVLFQGRNAQVAVNPQTGEIVTAFKTGSRLRRQLLRRAGLKP